MKRMKLIQERAQTPQTLKIPNLFFKIYNKKLINKLNAEFHHQFKENFNT